MLDFLLFASLLVSVSASDSDGCEVGVSTNPGCPADWLSSLRSDRQLILISKNCGNNQQNTRVLVSFFRGLTIHSFTGEIEVDWPAMLNRTDTFLSQNRPFNLTQPSFSFLIDTFKIGAINAIDDLDFETAKMNWEILEGEPAQDDYVLALRTNLTEDGGNILNVCFRDGQNGRDPKLPHLLVPGLCLLLDISFSSSTQRKLRSFRLEFTNRSRKARLLEHEYFNDENMPSVFRSMLFADSEASDELPESVVVWRPIYFLDSTRPVTRWCQLEATITPNSNSTIPFTTPNLTSVIADFAVDPCSRTPSAISQTDYFVWTCSFGFVDPKHTNPFLGEEMSFRLFVQMGVMFGLPVLLILTIEAYFKLKKMAGIEAGQTDTSPLLIDSGGEEQQSINDEPIQETDNL